MDLAINDDLKAFVEEKVQSGQFHSEEAVVEAALERFRKQDSRDSEELIDEEFLELCGREGDDRVTLEEVLEATSRIPGSMAQAIIDERADRI